MKFICLALLCLAALAPVAVTGDGCIATTIDFTKLPNGEELKGGDYL